MGELPGGILESKTCNHINTRQQLEHHWKRGCETSLYPPCVTCQSHNQSCLIPENRYLQFCSHPPPPQDKFVLTTTLQREVAVYLQAEVLRQVRGIQLDLRTEEKEKQVLHLRENESCLQMAREAGDMILEAWSSSR